MSMLDGSNLAEVGDDPFWLEKARTRNEYHADADRHVAACA